MYDFKVPMLKQLNKFKLTWNSQVIYCDRSSFILLQYYFDHAKPLTVGCNLVVEYFAHLFFNPCLLSILHGDDGEQLQFFMP